VPAFGVVPAADLYGVKVLDDSGGGSLAQIIAGMQWVVQEDADIMSMSLGATGFSSGEVVDTASDWGSSAPAAWPDQYTVPTIAAPGVDTLSSVPGGGYDDTYSGTSMAAPHVSGAVALALSATDANVTPATIEEALEMTAFRPADAPTPPGERDTRYGSGIIDANALTEYLKNPPEGETVSYTVALADTGDSLTGEVFVENGSSDPPGDAEFDVNITGASVPTAGEDLEVLVDIENLADQAGTQTVELTVDGPATDDHGRRSTGTTVGSPSSVRRRFSTNSETVLTALTVPGLALLSAENVLIKLYFLV
jgi:subtilisin family serine protease